MTRRLLVDEVLEHARIDHGYASNSEPGEYAFDRRELNASFSKVGIDDLLH